MAQPTWDETSAVEAAVEVGLPQPEPRLRILSAEEEAAVEPSWDDTLEVTPTWDDTVDLNDTPGILRQLEFGFESTSSDVQNLGLIMESYFPLGNIDFSFDEGLTYRSPEELYGPEFMAMDQEQRRSFLAAKREEAIRTEYADIYEAGVEDSTAAMVGSFGGAVASPTTLLPLGQSYKTAAGIGAVLGAEYDILSQYADKGVVEPEQTAVVAGVGGVLGPTGVAVQRGLNKVFAKSAAPSEDVLNQSIQNVEAMNDALVKAVAEEVPVPQMSEYVQNATGLSKDQVLESIAVSGMKPKVPTKAEVRIASAIPKDGVDPAARAKFPFLDDFMGSISTRIGNIAPELKNRLRNVDLQTHVKTHEDIVATKGFTNSMKQLPSKERETVNRLLMNGEFDAVERVLSRVDNNVTTQFRQTRGVLENLFKQLRAAGYKDLGYVKNYFPRVVKDYPGLMNALGKTEGSMITRAFAARAKQLKTSVNNLPVEEKDRIVNNILRGYSPKITNSGISFVKNRTIRRIDDQLAKYYEDPIASLHSYIRSAHNNIERRKFFGQNAVDMGPTNIDTEASIGNLVNSLADKLSPQQLDELTGLLQARFINGEKGASKTIQALRNVGYMTTLGNPISAMTQIGDLGVAAYANGIKNTLAALLSKRKITMQQMGLDDVLAEEFANEKKMATALHKLFTISGFRQVDRFGKNVILNGALRKGAAQAKSDKGISKLREKYGQSFGGEFPNLVDDLKAGNITDNVKLYLWNELADVQPISLSEMPRKYLEVPNGRIFYALKTFTLKQLDLLRRDIAQQWAKGNRKTAVRNAVAYSLLVPTTNVTVDMAKDLVLGRETTDDLEDRYVANVFKMFGTSQYLMDRFGSQGKLTQMATEMISPPLGYIDAVGTDLINLISGDPSAKTLNELPLIGRFWYNFFGGGLEKYQERQLQNMFGSESTVSW